MKEILCPGTKLYSKVSRETSEAAMVILAWGENCFSVDCMASLTEVGSTIYIEVYKDRGKSSP